MAGEVPQVTQVTQLLVRPTRARIGGYTYAASPASPALVRATFNGQVLDRTDRLVCGAA